MWAMKDIQPGKRYRLCLCQKGEWRYFSLVESQGPAPNVECALLTEEVPPELLLRRDILTIAERVPLTNGQPFFVDAHGLWLALAEHEAIVSRVPLSKIPWVTGVAPKFAPK
jgi:hypothetical protein